MREDTKAKCEAISAFRLVYILEQHTAGGGAQRRVTYHRLCEAYADSLGVQAKTLEWVFRMKYLDFASLKRAAVADDVSMCPIGAGRDTYDTIEAFIA